MTKTDHQILDELAQQLAGENGVPVSEVTIHVCGLKHCDHDSNGPWVEEGNFGSASCSKCGSLAIDRGMMELP